MYPYLKHTNSIQRNRQCNDCNRRRSDVSSIILGLFVVVSTTLGSSAMVTDAKPPKARITANERNLPVIPIENVNIPPAWNIPSVATESSKSDEGLRENLLATSSTAVAASDKNTGAVQKHRTEPSIFEKQLRRFKVFFIAAQVYINYQMAKWRTRRLEKKLGLPNEEYPEQSDMDNHPEVRALWSKVHERNAVRLTKNIQKLEGFWVKVGQYLSSRADIMPPEYLAHLVTLQDSLPPKPYEESITTLQEELSPEERSRIIHLDPTPLSTASLAQVHRATVTVGDGSETADVVLKVQHRGVASLMRQDMENLRAILELLAKFEPDADFSPVIREYNKEVQHELDFRREASNMDEVREVLENQGIQAIIPKTITGLVKERVLVMDFCQGFVVRDLEALDENRVDRELLLHRICSSWAVQMHVGGLYNADPHPGNILVSTDPNIAIDSSVPVLLDFGLTKRFEPDMKLAFARLMHASDETDVDSLMKSFDEMGLKMNKDTQDPFEDMAAMQRSFRETVPQDEARKKSAENSKRYKERQEAKKKDQKVKKLRNPVEAWPSELVFFGRVTNLLRGLCSTLGVRYPYLQTMADAARQTLRESVPDEERAMQLIHADSVRPCDTDIDQELMRKLETAIQKLDKNNDMVGLQLCVKSNGRTIANVAAGTIGKADSRPVTPSTLFNIFSTGKALLAIGVLRLVDEGKVGLDEPVSKYWKEFQHEDITVRHMLTHQAGLANSFPSNPTLDNLLDWSYMKTFIANDAEQEHPAGEQTAYHYLSFAWLCGGLIEAVTGRPYEEHLGAILAIDGFDLPDLFTGGIPEDINDKQLATLSSTRNTADASEPTDSEKARKRATVVKAKIEAERKFAAMAAKEKKANSVSDVESENDEEQNDAYKKTLAKYQGLQQLLNPSIFNMRKVRNAMLPSANMHSSAMALATVMDNVISKQHPLSNELISAAQVRQGGVTSSSASSALLDDSSAYFGLGFQVHEFKKQDDSGTIMRSIGHAGLGGSVVLAIPDANVTVAFTTNLLAQESVARKSLLNIVFDALGLVAPKSFH